MTHDVFVSFSTKDIAAARAVVVGLESKGIRCWFTLRDLTPGLEWGEAIVKAIEASKVMVVIISKDSNQSQVVREVERAVTKEVIVIPFRIENCNIYGPMAYFLSPAYWLDAFDPPIEKHLDDLADIVLKHLGYKAHAVSDPLETTWDIEERSRRENHKGGFGKRLSNIFGQRQVDKSTWERKAHQKDDNDQEGQLQVIDSFEVHGPSTHGLLQFCVGDLTNAGPNDSVDVLVVSASRDYYIPIPGSLIGALYNKGVSVEILAENKEADLRQAFSCWISHEIPDPPQGIRFKRILCYEPAETAKSAELVGDIFRSLAPFLGGHFPVRTVATPLVTSGFQCVSKKEILHQLVDSAVHWISSGLPLSCLKIICLPDENVAELTSLFSELKLRYADKSTNQRAKFPYDFFISYSHNDTMEVKIFEQTLLTLHQDLRLFIDRKNLKPGAAWQREIFEAIDNCRRVAAFYSPSYLDSKVCIEEFNIALCRHRESDESVLMPIYLYSATLPTYMRLVQFFDCREFDRDKLNQAADELIREVHK